MGNKINRKRAAVEERYTRPQGLYQHRDVDYKKLRRLILDSKLAPCYPGVDDSPEDLEECLICFLYYPSLNSSKCCFKGICTECFLQMKSPLATRIMQCPFCKTPNYAVEYRGTRTTEEKDLEQIEEQKLIEAKIKIQQQELQAEIRRMEHLEDEGNSSTGLSLLDSSESLTRNSVLDHQQTLQEGFGFVDGDEQGSPLATVNGSVSHADSDESSSSNGMVSVQEAEVTVPALQRSRRQEDFLLNLEDIMMMEAIWQSIQEHRQTMIFQQDSDLIASVSTPLLDCCKALRREESGYGGLKLSGIRGLFSKSNHGTGSLAVAIAKLAEQRVPSGDTSLMSQAQEMVSSHLLEADRLPNGHQVLQHTLNSNDDGRQEAAGRAPTVDMRQLECPHPTHIQNVTEVDASFSTSTSQTSDVRFTISEAFLSDRPSGFETNSAQAGAALTALPATFEEQMILAMALSLAEAQPLNSV